ncbi:MULTISPECIES: preprotein translocase subunit YajC [Microbacterium]|uniref:preprotein translocase subunit YajC n=1 Tax=Microbacterium TaxID=33882 RepID=UPI00146D7C92|nr:MULTISPECIES: preprotein translocase subunit YajC [Microbacterium]
MNDFIANYGLIILLVVLLVFMFWSSRRRMAKQKLEQEERARQTVPGAEVLLQGGLYGTIVSYDPDNLDQPAIVEIAPGVDIKVHSQAILRVVAPTEPVIADDEILPDQSAPAATDPIVATADDRADTTDPDSETGTKPQA